MKKLITFALAAILCISMCGCSDKEESSSDKSDSKQTEQAEKFNTGGFETAVSENTFPWLEDFYLNSSHESVYVATLSCVKPDKAEDGVYGCEELSVNVNGVEARDSLCYLLINGNTAAVNISFFNGFVEEGSEIEISAENFNELNEPEEGEEQNDYTDISDNVAFEGRLQLDVTVNESFGYLLFEPENKGVASITVSDTALHFEQALELFGEEPTKDSVKIILSDGTDISFDRCVVFHRVDEEGNDLDEFDAAFNFNDDEKTIDLSKVSEIIVNGENII